MPIRCARRARPWGKELQPRRTWVWPTRPRTPCGGFSRLPRLFMIRRGVSSNQVAPSSSALTKVCVAQIPAGRGEMRMPGREPIFENCHGRFEQRDSFRRPSHFSQQLAQIVAR
jgi:hypothetical protein